MDATVMKVRCDYCRGKLGLMVRRYWHMRFCSTACAQGYEQRLDETRAMMRQPRDGSASDPEAIENLPGSPALGSIA
jgi:hypothetical protein